MRYLKLFEGMSGEIDNVGLLEFVKDYLVYLTDEGFYVNVNPITSTLSMVELWKVSGDHNWDEFMWDEIKDQYVPMLQMLSKSYKLGISASRHFEEVFVMSTRDRNKYFYYSDIVSGEAESELQSMILQKIAIGVKL